MFSRLRAFGRSQRLADNYRCYSIGKLTRYGKPFEVNLLKYVGSRDDDVHTIYDKIEFLPSNYLSFMVDTTNPRRDLREILNGLRSAIKYEEVSMIDSENFTAKNLPFGARLFARFRFRRILFATAPLIQIKATEKNSGVVFHLMKVSGWLRSSFVLYSIRHEIMTTSKSWVPSYKRVDKKFLDELKAVLESYLR